MKYIYVLLIKQIHAAIIDEYQLIFFKKKYLETKNFILRKKKEKFNEIV